MDTLYAPVGALREERVCGDCGGKDFVEDHAAGDIVCRGCGLVAEAHIIDERSEWRTFGDKEKEGDDPSRVGGAQNPLTGGGGLSTGIAKAQGANTGQYNSLLRLHNRQSMSDRVMQTASREVSQVCDRLRVTDAVRNSALEIYKDVHDRKALKGRALKSVYAACIFCAAKRENNPRTFKEICAVMPDVNKVDIGRCFTAIDRMYKQAEQIKAMRQGKDLTGAVAMDDPQRMRPGAGKATQSTDLITRFMNHLGLDQKLSLFAARVGKNAQELAEVEAVPWGSRDPATQACAIIYGALLIDKLKNPDTADELPDFQQLADVGGMAPSTIRDGLRQMLPYLAMPGKLVALKDASPDTLARLEEAAAEALGPGGWDAKARKKAAAAKAAGGARPAAGAGGSAAAAGGYGR